MITINFGYLVYEGVADGNDYSGIFIRDYLQENAYTVTYRNILPETLAGFSAVFLSFGNYNSGSTALDDQMANTIIDYLEVEDTFTLKGQTLWVSTRQTIYHYLICLDWHLLKMVVQTRLITWKGKRML